ncbi:hypothetical protein BH09PSE5_BH09PSE5_06870 [soil metagenome]
MEGVAKRPVDSRTRATAAHSGNLGFSRRNPPRSLPTASATSVLFTPARRSSDFTRLVVAGSALDAIDNPAALRCERMNDSSAKSCRRSRASQESRFACSAACIRFGSMSGIDCKGVPPGDSTGSQAIAGSRWGVGAAWIRFMVWWSISGDRESGKARQGLDPVTGPCLQDVASVLGRFGVTEGSLRPATEWETTKGVLQ